MTGDAEAVGLEVLRRQMIREFLHQEEESGPDTWARLGQAGGVVLTRRRRKRGSGEPPSTEPG